MKTHREHRQTLEDDGFIVDVLTHHTPGQPSAPFLAVRPLRRPPATNSEFDEQVALVSWARRARHFIYAIPNEGSRSDAESSRRKREGLIKGAADLIWEPPFPLPAVAIEMKKAAGTLDDIRKPQAMFLSRRAATGRPCVVCFGYKAARYYIENLQAFIDYTATLPPLDQD